MHKFRLTLPEKLPKSSSESSEEVQEFIIRGGELEAPVPSEGAAPGAAGEGVTGEEALPLEERRDLAAAFLQGLLRAAHLVLALF